MKKGYAAPDILIEEFVVEDLIGSSSEPAGPGDWPPF